MSPFLLNGLAASDLLLTPTPPAQLISFNLKYLTRLPEMLERLEEEGVEPRLSEVLDLCQK
ncbi:hypothetical protein [Yersinia pestis]|uniref:hypothetical protein n=1 Tax=Yersinia pestis TaxID=632 RepID=UPI003CC52BEE